MEIKGSHLKWLAVITMLIDHIAASFIEAYALSSGINLMQDNMPICTIYIIMRSIGRLAFPIFCFLLVEGFCHTSNEWKYLIRLALFSFISEIPFDLAFSGRILDLSSQNVYFTLAIGLLCLILIKKIDERVKISVLSVLLQLVVFALGSVIASGLKTDYGMLGVWVIVIMYELRKKRLLSVFLGCMILSLSNAIEVYSLFILLPLIKYKGARGKQAKYFFYLFYPVHLLILGLLTKAFGFW